MGNEFSNLSLKPIVAIEEGKHCWEMSLPDISFTWTYTDDEQTCTGTSEDSRDVKIACDSPATDAPETDAPATDAPGTDAPEPPLPEGRMSRLRMRRYRLNKLH